MTPCETCISYAICRNNRVIICSILYGFIEDHPDKLSLCNFPICDVPICDLPELLELFPYAYYVRKTELSLLGWWLK